MTEDGVEFEGDLTLDAMVARLERFVDPLRAGGATQIIVDGDIVTVDPPATVEYEIEVGNGGETLGNAGTRGVEIDFERAAEERGRESRPDTRR